MSAAQISGMTLTATLPLSGALIPVVKTGSAINYCYDIGGPLNRLLGYDNGTAQSGSTNQLDMLRYFSGAGDGTTQFYSHVNRVHAQGANNIDFARESYAGCHIDTTSGVVNNASGRHQYVWLNTTGNVTFANIFEGHLRIDAGSITNQANYFNCASISFISGSANIVVGYNANQIGDAAKVTTAYSFNAQHTDAVSLAANFRSEMTLATNRWGFLQVGGASNGYAGKSKFGAVTTPTEAIDVNGNILTNGTILSTGGVIGHAVGAGGTTTQTTNKATGVEVDHPCGQITMSNAALAANTIVSFVLTNSFVLPDDDVRVWIKGGNASIGSYRVQAEGNANGSRIIVVENKTGGSLSEALVLGFRVHRAVIS